MAVLANDIGDRLSLSGVNFRTVQGGRSSIQSDSILYKPKTSCIGHDSFWYNFIDTRDRKNSTQITCVVRWQLVYS